MQWLCLLKEKSMLLMKRCTHHCELTLFDQQLIVLPLILDRGEGDRCKGSEWGKGVIDPLTPRSI